MVRPNFDFFCWPLVVVPTELKTTSLFLTSTAPGPNLTVQDVDSTYTVGLIVAMIRVRAAAFVVGNGVSAGAVVLP